jgi:hypothetical protein
LEALGKSEPGVFRQFECYYMVDLESIGTTLLDADGFSDENFELIGGSIPIKAGLVIKSLLSFAVTDFRHGLSRL